MIESVVIFAAGVWAGGINVIVGSGALVTFPTLLLFGYPPLTANVSNNIGIVDGGVSGIYGYRSELRPNRAIWCASHRHRSQARWSRRSCCSYCPTTRSRRSCPPSSPWPGHGGLRPERATPHGRGPAARALRTCSRECCSPQGSSPSAFTAVLRRRPESCFVGLMGLLLSDGIQRLTAIRMSWRLW